LAPADDEGVDGGAEGIGGGFGRGTGVNEESAGITEEEVSEGGTDSCLPLHPTVSVEHNYTTSVPAPGDLAFRWIYGSICAASNKDPRIQILPTTTTPSSSARTQPSTGKLVCSNRPSGIKRTCRCL